MSLPSQCADEDGTDGGECTYTSQNHGYLLGISLFVGLGGYYYLTTWLYATVI